MSGGYRQTIGPTRARLMGYLADVETTKAKNGYTTLQAVQYEIDRIERAFKLLDSYNDKWLLLLSNITDQTAADAEKAIYDEFAENDTGFLKVIQDAQEAIDYLLAAKRDIIIANAPTPPSTLPAAPVVTPPIVPPQLPYFPYSEDEIPNFNGDVFKWTEFHEIFKAIIDDQAYPPIKKFAILKKHLTGDAAKSIDGLPLNEANYLVAKEILMEQFGKSMSVKASLFTSLKNLKPANDATSSMRDLFQKVNCICRQLLMAYNEDIDHPLVIQTIVGKFPEATMLSLENMKPLNQWKFKELMDKLNTTITNKEDVHRLFLDANNHIPSIRDSNVFTIKNQSTTATYIKRESFNNRNGPQPNTGSTNNPNRNRNSNGPKNPIPCILCDGNHLKNECTRYSTGKARSNRLRELHRCGNCTSKDHDYNQCPSKRNCYHCNGRHNSIACFIQYPESTNKNNGVNKTPSKLPPKQSFYPKRSTNAVTSTPIAPPAYYSPSGTPTTITYAYHTPQTAPQAALQRPNQAPFSFPAALPSIPPTYLHAQASIPPPAISQTAMTTTPKNIVNNAVETVKHGASDVEAILLTAKCRIFNPVAPENSILANVFFDSGSQRSFVHDRIKGFLNLEPIHHNPSMLQTFGSDVSQHLDTPTVPFCIATTDGNSIYVEAQTVHRLIQPIHSVNLSNIDLEHISNAQQLVAEKVEPDILVGIDYYWRFFYNNGAQLLPSGFYLINSRVGSMISGQGKLENQSPISCYSVMTSLIGLTEAENENDITDAEIQTVYELDSLKDIGIEDDPHHDEQLEKDKLLDKQIEVVDGRYQVPWLWKDKSKKPNLSSNYWMAFNQLKTMLNRVRNHPNANVLVQKFIDYFQVLFDLRIIEVAPEDCDDPTVFLPFHVVFKPGSETTDFRIVYNASAKTKDGQSLNENLYAGPIRIPDLSGILLRFREKRFVVISDLEKAFLQVGLKNCDRNTTCFLWLRDPNGPVTKENIIILRFTRIAFGVITSPYLLAAVIKHHLNKYNSPLSIEILRSIYIDNVLFTSSTVEEAQEKIVESIALFSTAKMNLRQHISNSPEINNFIADRQPLPKGPHKILGIPWDIPTDCMILKSLKVPPSMDVWTKRKILKIIAQTFDPLGLLCPVNLKVKVFFQSLWLKNYTWDKPLKTDDVSTWHQLLEESCGAVVSIPRYLMNNVNTESSIDLHVFADASKHAYGIACYLKIQFDNTSQTKLILAKSRLAPTKGLSNPKLELLGMFNGVKAARFISREMTYSIRQTYFWSDARCVLCWIKSNKDQKRFIENRLKEIRSFPDAIFRYVPTAVNPADLATRGVPAAEIENLKIWWEGPEFLKMNAPNWPPTPDLSNEVDLEQPALIMVQATQVTTTPIKDFINMSKFNSWDSLLLTTCFILQYLLLSAKNFNIKNSPIFQAARIISAITKKDI